MSAEILELANRFHRNRIAFWTQHRWFIYIFMVALFCDAMSTTHFMVAMNHDYSAELHPMVRLAAQMFGAYAGPMIGFAMKLLAGLLICIYLRPFARLIMVLGAGISFAAAWYNVWGIYIS